MAVYMGGKARIGRQMAKFIQENYAFKIYVEPFCGMFSVGKHIQADRRIASDAHEDVILFLQAVQNGWQAPKGDVTREMWKELKHAEPSAMRCFAGHLCSFGGRFFNSWVDKTDTAKRTVDKLHPLIQGVEFHHRDYRKYKIPKTGFAYLDPPYGDVLHHPSWGKFITEEFWDWTRQLKCEGVVLEFDGAPKDFHPYVWEKEVISSMNSRPGSAFKRKERLYHFNGRSAA